MVASGAKLLPIGALELPGKGMAMELNWGAHNNYAAEWFHQNAAFVVSSIVPPQTGTK